MERRLLYDDQDDELKSQFNQLRIAVSSINENSSEEDVRALNERIQREVTAKPFLARIVQHKKPLLSAVCTALENEFFHPAIKFLILANPSALLWTTTIHLIAGHSAHCVLMPWIATMQLSVGIRDGHL